MEVAFAIGAATSPTRLTRSRAALAYAVGNQTERAYRRGEALDQRLKVMDAWAAYCERKAASNSLRLAR
jgi:hypothetical protein